MAYLVARAQRCNLIYIHFVNSPSTGQRSLLLKRPTFQRLAFAWFKVTFVQFAGTARSKGLTVTVSQLGVWVEASCWGIMGLCIFLLLACQPQLSGQMSAAPKCNTALFLTNSTAAVCGGQYRPVNSQYELQVERKCRSHRMAAFFAVWR